MKRLLKNVKLFLFRLACKLIGFKEIHVTFTKTDGDIAILSKRPLSQRQLKGIDRILIEGEAVNFSFKSLPGDLSGVDPGTTVNVSIRKSLVELATKTKKESGIVKEGDLIIEEK